jgi:two-component system chemotaxis response regulator CheY
MTSCLLIDENGAEIHRLRAMLDGLGIETLMAGCPDDALKFCNDNAPDVVLVAAASAGRRPKDLVRKLRREHNGKSPIVILYADQPDTEMIGQSIMQGAADVLMKPFDRDILQFKLRQAGVIS